MTVRLGHTMDYALSIAVLLATVMSAHAQAPAQQSAPGGRPAWGGAPGPARRAGGRRVAALLVRCRDCEAL